jgi:hypothetical protein
MNKYLKILSLITLIVFCISCNRSNSKENNDNSKTLNSDSIRSDVTQTDSLDNIVLNLLDVSAQDFYAHQPPVPVGFREVKIKYLTKPIKERTYLICGQFLDKNNQNKQEWTFFATIKTDPYEQWIGSNALTYCQDSKELMYTKIDLSIALKSRIDSLQKLRK